MQPPNTFNMTINLSVRAKGYQEAFDKLERAKQLYSQGVLELEQLDGRHGSARDQPARPAGVAVDADLLRLLKGPAAPTRGNRREDFRAALINDMIPLLSEPRRLNTLSEMVPAKRSSVHRALRELERQGRVMRTSSSQRTMWVLTAPDGLLAVVEKSERTGLCAATKARRRRASTKPREDLIPKVLKAVADAKGWATRSSIRVATGGDYYQMLGALDTLVKAKRVVRVVKIGNPAHKGRAARMTARPYWVVA